MINCSDNTYVIFYTDTASGAIAIPKSALDQETLDIALVGKTRLEYGEILNENLLHLLEHFSSRSTNIYVPATELPNKTTIYDLLENPVVGQIWFNSEFKSVNVCVQTTPTIEWREINSGATIAGNSGIISHGEALPKPQTVDGVVFEYSDCVWNVSPYFFDQGEPLLSFSVSTDANAVVSCSYTTSLGTVQGVANYVIMGIRGNEAPPQQSIICPTPTPTPTPSATLFNG